MKTHISGMKAATLPITLILAALPAATTIAQTVLDEVVVTARKRAESLMETPLSVVAVSGAKMDEVGITNLVQLSSQIPNLSLGGGAQVSNIYMRGIGSGVNRGFDQSVGMYVDGIYQMRSKQFTQSMFDLDRVEVLRGPQSILFGKNTVAGAIKVETATAEVGEEFNGSVGVDYEPDQGTTRATAVFSGGGDRIAARLALRYQESDGYVSNVWRGSDEISSEDTMMRLSLAWEPSDTVSVVGKLSYLNAEGEGSTRVNHVVDPSLLASFGTPGNSLGLTSVAGSIAAFAVPGYGPAVGGAEYESWVGNEVWYPGGNDMSDVESMQASLRINWSLGNIEVESLSAYVDWQEDLWQDVDFHPGNVAGNLELDDMDQFSQELRISSNYDGRVNFVAGVYYEKQTGLVAGGVTSVDGSLGGVFGQLPAAALNPAFPPGLTLSDLGINSIWNGSVLGVPALAGVEAASMGYAPGNDVDNKTTAFFAEVDFDLTDTLKLSVGGRYSDETKDWYKTQGAGVGYPGNFTLLVNPDLSFTDAGEADPLLATLSNIVISGALGRQVAENQLEYSTDHFDPSVRLTWDVNPDTMWYLSWTTGYKSGGITGGADSINPDGTPGPGTFFGDEEVSSWEVGVKNTFGGGRGRVAATAYRQAVDDLQVTSFQGLAFVVSNAAKLTATGLELESQYAVTDAFEIGTSIAYLQAEYDDYTTAPCTIYQEAASVGACAQDLTGRPTPFAPEWSANFYGVYDREIGSNLRLRMRADANYKDEYFTDGDLDPNSLQESVWKLDARVGIGSVDEVWEVALYGRNLTDKRVLTFTLDAPLSAGIYAGGVAEPRVWGLQGLVRF